MNYFLNHCHNVLMTLFSLLIFEADEIIWSEQIKKITDISNVRKNIAGTKLLAENNTP